MLLIFLAAGVFVVIVVVLGLAGGAAPEPQPKRRKAAGPSAYKVGGAARLDAPPAPAHLPRLAQATEFNREVVGESFYGESFRALLGGARAQAARLEAEAVLTPDPDNPHDANAVAVTINGLKVGHLSRSDAARYCAELAALGRAGEAAACAAVLIVSPESTGGAGVRLAFRWPLRLA